MNKLETAILNTLEKFKSKRVNLYAAAARQHLAEEIARDIRSEIKKERKTS
jgi:hypothetical protein